MSRTTPRPRSHRVSTPAMDRADRDSGRKQSSRKNVTVACKLCRERRTRCDGQAPCSRCVRLGSGCSYAQDPDGRSQLAIKRKYENIQDESDFLSELLTGIRNGTDDQVNRVISLIRSDVPIKEVRDAIQQQLVDSSQIERGLNADGNRMRPAVQLYDEQIETPPSCNRGDVLRIHRITASPLYQLPASPWTRVTTDCDLVSELISTWVVWDKPWSNFISIHHFIRDMQTGNLDSVYCSPFLVSCILAWACPYSDWPEARTSNGAMSSLMKDFISEAEIMFKAEVGKGATIPLVQGCVILAWVVRLCGQEQHGYQYLSTSMEMSEELTRFERLRKPAGDEEHRKEHLQVLGLTCWGLFNITVAVSLASAKPHGMKMPHHPKPVILSEADQEGMWAPYPRSTKFKPSYTQELMDFRCDVAVYESALAHLLYNVESIESLGRRKLEQESLRLLQKISDRTSAMPGYMRLQEDSPIGVYCHVVWSLSVKARVLFALRQPADNALEVVQQSTKDECVKAALEIAHICKLRTRAYGHAPVPLVFLDPVSTAIRALVELSDTLRTGEALAELCNCLHAIGRRWPRAFLKLSGSQLRGGAYGIETPRQVYTSFDGLETGEQIPSFGASNQDCIVPATTDLKDASFQE